MISLKLNQPTQPEPLARNRVNVQWRCRGDHPDCSAKDWQLYKAMDRSEATEFLKLQAPNDVLFEYRAEERPSL